MLILDGWNVVHHYYRGGVRPRNLADLREEFLNILQTYLVYKQLNADVYFDGGEGAVNFFVRRQILRGRLTAITTPRNTSADDAILDRIKTVRDRKSIKVITSDLVILNAAQERKIPTQTSEAFVRELETFLKTGPSVYDSRKTDGISDGEAEYWMREFGIGDPPDVTPDPPGSGRASNR